VVCIDSVRYRLHRKIGEGNYGAVYICVDTDTNLKYACKVINKTRNKHWEREVKSLTEVDCHKPNHQFVMHALHVGIQSQNIFMVTPYMKGGNLFEKLTTLENFPEAEARRVLIQVARGIEYLHSVGICHRDIKLENILCSEEEQYYRVVLADFGFSKPIEDGLQTGGCGTLHYIAPEVLFPTKEYTAACDIWSFGVVVYYLLTRHFPFSVYNLDGALNERATANLIQSGSYHENFIESSGVSTPARDFIKKLLVVDPNKRPVAFSKPSDETAAATKLFDDPWLRGR